MTDYSDLTDNIRNYTETDTNVLSNAIIQPFIKSIEDQIMRTVDLNLLSQIRLFYINHRKRFFTVARRLASH